MKFIKYLTLPLLAFLLIGAVAADSSKTGKFPTRTNIESCTLAMTPVDADVSFVGSKCYRDGQFLVIHTHISWAGAGTATALAVSIAGLSGSPVIDGAALPNGGNAASNQAEDMLDGQCLLYSSGAAAWFVYIPIYKSTTTFEMTAGSAHLLQSVPASGSAVKCTVRIPIVGWN